MGEGLRRREALAETSKELRECNRNAKRQIEAAECAIGEKALLDAQNALSSTPP